MTCVLRGAQNQGMRRTVRMRRARTNDAYLEGDALDAATRGAGGLQLGSAPTLKCSCLGWMQQ